MECRKEGMQCQPVRGTAHGRVEERLGGGANDGYGGKGASGNACGGANSGCSGQGAGLR
jgi:hypothetical protein